MGLAIIVPNISFANSNLGKVTLAQDIDVTAISIVGSDSVNNEGNTSTYSIAFTPSNTNQRTVTWSIVSGEQYASINSSTGVLSVKEGASASSVTIKAVSSSNSSVFATKNLTVTYKESTPVLNYKIGYTVDGSGVESTDANKAATDYVPVSGTSLFITNSYDNPNPTITSSYSVPLSAMFYVVRCYDSSKTCLGSATVATLTGASSNTNKNNTRTLLSNTAYIRIVFGLNKSANIAMTDYYENSIITINNVEYELISAVE